MKKQSESHPRLRPSKAEPTKSNSPGRLMASVGANFTSPYRPLSPTYWDPLALNATGHQNATCLRVSEDRRPRNGAHDSVWVLSARKYTPNKPTPRRRSHITLEPLSPGWFSPYLPCMECISVTLAAILEASTEEGWLLGVMERLQELSNFSKNWSVEREPLQH